MSDKREGTQPAPSGPVERADARRANERQRDVEVDGEGKVRQRPHGSIDETMTPQKPEENRGPYAPPEGHLDNPKDVEPRGKDDLSA